MTLRVMLRNARGWWLSLRDFWRAVAAIDPAYYDPGPYQRVVRNAQRAAEILGRRVKAGR